MSKETEIHKMLSYLSETPAIHVRAPNVFGVESSLGLSSPEAPCKAGYYLTIDFNKKNLEVYSYDESYHNGDHYNCTHTNVSWKKLPEMYKELKRLTLIRVEQKVIEAERKRACAERQVHIDAAFESLIKS